jgi:hypothetical protein
VSQETEALFDSVVSQETEALFDTAAPSAFSHDSLSPEIFISLL